MLSPAAEETLRRLALGDESLLGAVPSRIELGVKLDPRSVAFVRLGALVALDAPGASYQCEVEAALAAGATVEDVVAVLTAVAPATGSARVVSAAPRLALAVGYDVEAALEGQDDPASGRRAEG